MSDEQLMGYRQENNAVLYRKNSRALSRAKVRRVCHPSVFTRASSTEGSSSNRGDVAVRIRTFVSS